MTPPCTDRHYWEGAVCGVCGAYDDGTYDKQGYKLPMIELIRKQRERPPVQPPRSRKGRPTYLHCPKCGNERLTWTGRVYKYDNKKSRKVRCPQCGYVWRTSSREAFGGNRTLIVSP